MALGPLGAAIGAAIGHQYDLNQERRGARPPGEQFFLSTFRTDGACGQGRWPRDRARDRAARSVMQSLRLDASAGAGGHRAVFRGQAAGLRSRREMTRLRASCQSQPEILRIFVEIQLRFALAGSDMTGGARTRVVERAAPAGYRAAAVRAHRGGAARRRARRLGQWITRRARPRPTSTLEVDACHRQ